MTGADVTQKLSIGIGQQQHLDAAGAKAFELRRGFEPGEIVAGQM